MPKCVKIQILEILGAKMCQNSNFGNFGGQNVSKFIFKMAPKNIFQGTIMETKFANWHPNIFPGYQNLGLKNFLPPMAGKIGQRQTIV